MSMVTSPEARAIQAKHRLRKQLGSADGLIGLGIEETAPETLEIVAHVASKDCPVCDRIPDEWEGFRVRVVISGLPSKKR